MSKLAATALAVPGCVVAVASAAALLMTAVSQPPMWPHEPVNLAEAAGVRDESEVVRLIEMGADPNARYPIRAGLVFGRATSLTPIEAAVANDDPTILSQLLARGAVMDASAWTRLHCIAEGDTIRSALERLQPQGAALACDGVVKRLER